MSQFLDHIFCFLKIGGLKGPNSIEKCSTGHISALKAKLLPPKQYEKPGFKQEAIFLSFISVTRAACLRSLLLSFSMHLTNGMECQFKQFEI